MVRSVETQKEFSELVREDLLIWFCRHYGYPTDGFECEAVRRVSDHDARWFLDALSTEQGRRTISPRPLIDWVEPVITIGAASRLHTEFGWPKELIGLQSHDGWAFDLIGYDSPGRPRIAAEIKKTDREIDELIEAMTQYISQAPLHDQPGQPMKPNAYRKVVALRRMGARLLWVLGPSGDGQVFRVEHGGEHGAGSLERVENGALCY